MTQEINRIKWKSRRGMRELDLLFRPIITNDIADFNDKNMKLQSVEHEIFLKKILKK